MLALQRQGFSAEEVKNALHGVYAPVQMRFHYDLLDADNNYIRTLDNVLDGEVACNSLAHIKRTAKFSLKETVPDKPFEIGGRNLFLNSDFSAGSDEWAALPAIQEEEGIAYVSQGYSWGVRYDGLEVKEGETYTMSALVRENINTSRFRISILSYTPEIAAIGNIYGSSFTGEGGWIRYSGQYTIPSGVTSLRLYFLASSGTEKIDITQIKIEQGNKATDWSPAPEDQGYQTWLAEQKQQWIRETEQIDYLSDRIQPFVELKVPEIKRKHDDYALAFYGVNDYVSSPVPVGLTVNSSYEAWFNMRSTNDNWSAVISNLNYGTPATGFNIIPLSTAIKITWGDGVGAYQTRVFPQTVNLNTWNHVAVVYDTDRFKAYFNNVYIGEIVATLVQNYDTFVVGKWSNVYSDYFFDGKINNVSIWNKALTQTEIQANMNKRLTGNEPNLVGLWRFNEGTGTIAKDSTPNGNDGTIYGAKYEKAVIELETIPSKYITFPLGIFLLSSPTRADQNNMIIREIDAYDGLIVLKEDKFIDRYNVPTGTNYVDAVIQILQSAGITKWNIEQTDKVLDTDIEFEPGKEKLFAINEILRQINYDGIKVDVYGYYSSAYYRSPTQRSAEYTYIDDSESVTVPGMEEEYDLTEAPNQFVVIRSNSEQAPLRSEYTNDRVDSPISTVNRGRTIVRYETVNDMADQQALDGYVQRIAAEASQIYGKITFETAIMPFHDIDDVLNVEYSRLGIKAKYAETKWSFPLQSGGTMSHELRKVVTV